MAAYKRDVDSRQAVQLEPCKPRFQEPLLCLLRRSMHYKVFHGKCLQFHQRFWQVGLAEPKHSCLILRYVVVKLSWGWLSNFEIWHCRQTKKQSGMSVQTRYSYLAVQPYNKNAGIPMVQVTAADFATFASNPELANEVMESLPFQAQKAPLALLEGIWKQSGVRRATWRIAQPLLLWASSSNNSAPISRWSTKLGLAAGPHCLRVWSLLRLVEAWFGEFEGGWGCLSWGCLMREGLFFQNVPKDQYFLSLGFRKWAFIAIRIEKIKANGKVQQGQIKI